jgi:hypothetical protein
MSILRMARPGKIGKRGAGDFEACRLYLFGISDVTFAREMALVAKPNGL